MRRDQDSGLIRAVRKALEELAELLEEFPGVVVVGGNVPYLLIPQEEDPHEGTVDIDLVLANTLAGTGTLQLGEVLMRLNYQQDPKQAFRHTKTIAVEGQNYQVLLELLGGGPTSPDGLRNFRGEDVYVSIIPGMEVAHVAPVDVSVGEFPLSVASLPAFFAMKATALSLRDASKRAKDAYDIVYCLRNYPGGTDAIAAEFAPLRANPLINAGVGLLGELFASNTSIGPAAYALYGTDDESSGLLAREAYERVQDLLERLW